MIYMSGEPPAMGMASLPFYNLGRRFENDCAEKYQKKYF
jgi:hypothetical protein